MNPLNTRLPTRAAAAPSIRTGAPTVSIDSLRVSVPDMEPARAQRLTEQALFGLARVLEQDPRFHSSKLHRRNLDGMKLRLELSGDSDEALESALTKALSKALLGTEE